MKPAAHRGLGIAGSLVLLFAFSSSAFAQGVADKISVNDPYVREVPPVIKTSAAFMRLQNSGDTERFLIAASTPAATAVELHMHTMQDGVMRMRRIAHIHLPPGETVSLQPGGLHIMLFDLTAPLKTGERVPLTLVFDDGSTKEIHAEVRSVMKMMQN